MQRLWPYPSRFVRVIIEDETAGRPEPVIIEGSANNHPYIDPNKTVQLEELWQECRPRPRIGFDYICDIAQIYPSCQIKIFNFPAYGNPLLQLSERAKVRLEAGYNGHPLNAVIDGYLMSEPFTSPDFPNNYTLLQVSTRKPDFKEEFELSLPNKQVRDFVAAIESRWGVILKFSRTAEGMPAMLESPLNLTLKGDLQDALEYLKSHLELQFVHEYENIFQGYFINGERSEEGRERARPIEEGVIKFEFLFKAKEKLEKSLASNDYIPENFSNKEYFNKAESRKYEAEAVINRPYFVLDNPKLKKAKQRQTDAKVSLFLQGGFRIGSFVEYSYHGSAQVFSVKSISMMGDTHGRSHDFKTDLELYAIQ